MDEIAGRTDQLQDNKQPSDETIQDQECGQPSDQNEPILLETTNDQPIQDQVQSTIQV
jgi:hypothetical protein